MQEWLIRTFKGLDAQAYGASLLRGAYNPLSSQMRSGPALRSPWFLAFEATVLELLRGSTTSGKPHSIDLVFDRQDEFFDRAHGLFRDILRTKAAKAERLKVLSFAPKDDLAALQAVDIITYEVNQYFSEQEKAAASGRLPFRRWQLDEVRKYIPVNGSFWDAGSLEALIETTRELNARNAVSS